MKRVKQQPTKVISSRHTYWDHVRDNRGWKWEDGRRGEAQETPRANPDMLDETMTPWEITDAQKEVQGRVYKLIDLARQILTEQQYKAFVLCIYNDPALTEREAAVKMGLSHQRVHHLVITANLKLQKAYEERT